MRHLGGMLYPPRCYNIALFIALMGIVRFRSFLEVFPMCSTFIMGSD